MDYDKSLTMIDMFEEQVKLHPDKVAVIHNGNKITYQMLNEKANKLAGKLTKIHQNSSTIQ